MCPRPDSVLPAATPANVRADLVGFVGTPEMRRVASELTPSFFDKWYCKMRPARHRSAWLDTIERTRLEAIRTGTKKGVMFLAPRNHGKTEAVISVLTRLICLNRNIRILFVAERADYAKRRLARIQRLLRSDLVRVDWVDPQAGYPDFEKDPDGQPLEWNKTQITVYNTQSSVDPTISAVGVNGALIGAHFDVVVFDDVESRKRVKNPAMREQTRHWFTTEVWPALNLGGICICVGTRKHSDDLYATLMKHPAFSVIQDPALFHEVVGEDGVMRRVACVPDHEMVFGLDEAGKQVAIDVTIKDPTVKCLWEWDGEKGFPVKQLLLERYSASITDSVSGFAREYLHIVTDESSAAFKELWVDRALTRGANLRMYCNPYRVDGLGKVLEGPADFVVYQSWDLALTLDAKKAEAMDRDFTVGTTAVFDKRNRDLYIIGVVRFRGASPQELKERVEREYQTFVDLGLPPKMVIVENNSFAQIHYHALSELNIPFFPHHTGKNKHDLADGLPGVCNLFETGRVVIAHGDTLSRDRALPLREELVNYGTAAHDDHVIGVWLILCAVRMHALQDSLRPQALSQRNDPSMGTNLQQSFEFDGNTIFFDEDYGQKKKGGNQVRAASQILWDDWGSKWD